MCDLLEERGATPDELMAALLHDAAEAYLGDLPHPLKHRSELGAAFRVAEKRLEAVIAERFALPEAAARIKPLDKALLATERRTFSEVTWHWPELDGAEELDIEIEPWDSARALREFTARYERIDALRRAASRRRPGARRGRRPASARRSSSGCSGQRRTRRGRAGPSCGR